MGFDKLTTPLCGKSVLSRTLDTFQTLGFDKIIIKNGLMIYFFISNPMSPYYRSSTFTKVLERVGENPVFNLKQVENKLKIVVRNVDSIKKAWSLLSKLR